MKKNRGSLYRTFLSATLTTSIASVVVGLLLAYQGSKVSMTDQEAAKDLNYATTISHLLLPSMEISNYREVQNLLGRLNNDYYDHAVVDSSGEILLADFSSYALVRGFVPSRPGLRCDELPKLVDYKYTEPARIICSPVAGPDDNQLGKSKNMGLLLVLRRAPTATISLRSFGILFGAFLLTILVSLGILQLLARKKLVKPLEALILQIGDAKRDGRFDPNSFESKSFPAEYQIIIEEFGELYNKLEGELERKSEFERKSALGNLAAQVAHDIRSPLSALNMVATQLKEIPEDKRLIIRNSAQRINDIANGLIQQTKRAAQGAMVGSQTSAALSERSTVMLVALLDSIVSEKRVQFRERMGVEIEADLNQGYGLFAAINSTEFSRTISNLINNSVEACEDRGRVTVSIRGDTKNVLVTVTDNGKGIPKEILEKLGARGVTHGKEGSQSGAGIGVSHARETVEAFGGQFSIESKVGEGTVILMDLPRAETPKWFVEKLILDRNALVVSADDDQTIHQIWSGRLSSGRAASAGIRHMTFSSLEQLEEWVGSSMSEGATGAGAKVPVFLVDYEFLGQKSNGLEAIGRMGIGKQAILITSRYEEPAVRSKAEALGVRIIPKGLAPFVPIEIGLPKIKYDAVLIDDDKLVQMTWNMEAKEKGKTLICFTTPEEFLLKAVELDPLSPLFIDVHLGNGVRGDEFAKKVVELGFTEISLATGYEPETIVVPVGVKRVVGKYPIF